LDNPLFPDGSVRIFGFTKEIKKAAKLFGAVIHGSTVPKFSLVNNFFRYASAFSSTPRDCLTLDFDSSIDCRFLEILKTGRNITNSLSLLGQFCFYS
jgi:hypothetical protein